VRKYIGLSLYVTGGLMLSFSAGRYVTGAITAQQARRTWDSAGAKVSVALARSPEHENPAIDDGAPVARLIIPSIALDEIVLEGSDELNGGPGHVRGSAMPGESGNAVITGERDRHFSHLDALSAGDTIVTESGLSRDTWIVMQKRVVEKDDRVVARTPDTTLTLTTSWPIRFVGPAPERLIVTASRVSRPASRVAPAN
jgi:sortase A